jgi:hypothetical protein
MVLVCVRRGADRMASGTGHLAKVTEIATEERGACCPGNAGYSTASARGSPDLLNRGGPLAMLTSLRRATGIANPHTDQRPGP